MDGSIIKNLLKDIKNLGLGGAINRELLDRIEDCLKENVSHETIGLGVIEKGIEVNDNACPECKWVGGKHTKKCSKREE